MNTEELFVDVNALPGILSEEEFNLLIDRVKFDEEALNKIMIHNIKLVLQRVCVKFKTVQYDKKDLVSIGNIGLLKAIKTYDKNKKIKFASYASVCIDNEILMFLRKERKMLNAYSLDSFIFDDENNKTIINLISDENNIEEDYIDKEKYIIVKNIINELSNKDRELIFLYFGFYKQKYNQKQLAEMFNCSQSFISKRITEILKYIKKRLQYEDILDDKNKTKCKSKLKIIDE